jgi:predicted ABC-class ATPase
MSAEVLGLDELVRKLRKIDGRGYKAYQILKGSYEFSNFTLFIDRVQGDPFATPSNVRIRIPQRVAGFPAEIFSSRSREIALRDFLTRALYQQARKHSRKAGSGYSGLIKVERPSQKILERNSAFVKGEWIELRFRVGLPASGRKILASEAKEIFTERIPEIAEALRFKNLDRDEILEHVKTAEDADFLRNELPSLNLVAFVADGSILPRKSGIDERPLENAIPFESPPSLRISVELPNRGEVTGMGIRKGVTLIVGGGYHGKSTLLKALEAGIYNHIPGDGRELVVSNPKAVKIRAEDGRRVEMVDISAFIGDLPFGKDTRAFSTENASGSTSQAANIIEAIEAGAEVLLIDEDTSATNFMIRDFRMQELVPKEIEPITPFIDRVRQLYETGVSTVIVMGGSGDYFDVADCVICMINYRPHDYTEKAKVIAEKFKLRKKEVSEGFKLKSRMLKLEIRSRRNEIKISVRGRRTILFGGELIDLSCVEQIFEVQQTRSIAYAIYRAMKYMDGKRTLKEVVDDVMGEIRKKGLDILAPLTEFAEFRDLELAAAINRMRNLECKILYA